jgi:DNA-binding MurR/RpiR family transcriptional regulator
MVFRAAVEGSGPLCDRHRFMSTATVEPPVGGTIGHIVGALPSLLPSEQRVAQLCVEAPEDVIDMSGADVAARTETSPATVSRACQAMGFRGFQHLRFLLVRDLGAQTAQQTAPLRGTRGRLQAVAERAADALRGSLDGVDPDAFDRAADVIAGARRLLISSTGASAPSAQAVALRFTVRGRPCEAPMDGVIQQLTASVLEPGDVCLAVSESGSNVVTVGAAMSAREAGATVVGVTSFARAPLAEHSDLLLIGGARAQSFAHGWIAGNLVQTLLLSALEVAVHERVHERTPDRSERAARAAERVNLRDLLLGGGEGGDEETP